MRELASLRGQHGSQLLFSATVHTASAPRDNLGRVVTRSELSPSTNTSWSYLYDAQGRLEEVLRDGDLYARFTYDDNGNRLTRETDSETLVGEYDAQDRLLRYGPYAYTYTASGQLTSKTDTRTGEVTAYRYDVRGNLLRVDLPNGDVIEYLVDGQDRRVAKKKNGAFVRRWLYRDQLRIAAELDASGALLSRFVYASRSHVPDYIVRTGVTIASSPTTSARRA